MNNVHPVTDLEVVAIRGKGLYVVDKAGNAWHIAGHTSLEDKNDGLSQAYHNAVE